MLRFVGLLLMLGAAACSTIPRQGPLGKEVVEQSQVDGRQRFDVVPVDDRVVATLLAQAQPPFHERFKKYEPPPELPIAVGDLIGVTIWEAAGEGLFGQSMKPVLPTGEELAATLRAAGIRPPRAGSRVLDREALLNELKTTPQGQLILQAIEAGRRTGTTVPDQTVGADGGISVPYGGRLRVAGLTPGAAQQKVEEALAGKAIEPRALLVVKRSNANAVSVTGELIHGARITLSPGGTRLLDVIAAAGGAQAPVHQTFVRLSRDGVTATIPLAVLVGNPDENIYARPGDVLAVVRQKRVISVFGATGHNDAIAFNADTVYLSEALGQAGGLLDNQADPQSVFLLRYEPPSLAQALGAPPVADAGMAPVAYRLDLRDAKSYGLAKRFPVRDRDIIYVANAETLPIQRVMEVFSNVTAPALQGYRICRDARC